MAGLAALFDARSQKLRFGYVDVIVTPGQPPFAPSTRMEQLRHT